MRNNKLFLFDFFGVLSTPCYYPIIKQYIPTDLQENYINRLDDLDIGLLPEAELVKLISEQINKTTIEVFTIANSNSQLNIELINFIEKNIVSKFRVGLLTNIPSNMLTRLFVDYLELFSPKYISSELKMIKPNKEIFEYVIKDSQQNPKDIYFIDDSKKNIEMSSSLGINSILHINNTTTIKYLESIIVH